MKPTAPSNWQYRALNCPAPTSTAVTSGSVMRAAEDCAATSSLSRKRSTDGSLPFLAHGSETSLPMTPAVEVSLLTPSKRMERTGSQMALCGRGHAHTVWASLASAPLHIQRKRYHKRP